MTPLLARQVVPCSAEASINVCVCCAEYILLKSRRDTVRVRTRATRAATQPVPSEPEWCATQCLLHRTRRSSLWERKQAQRQAKEAVRRAKEEAFLNATQVRQPPREDQALREGTLYSMLAWRKQRKLNLLALITWCRHGSARLRQRKMQRLSVITAAFCKEWAWMKAPHKTVTIISCERPRTSWHTNKKSRNESRCVTYPARHASCPCDLPISTAAAAFRQPGALRTGKSLRLTRHWLCETLCHVQSELCNEWNTQVFEKIQGRLQTAVSKRDGREIMRRLKVRAADIHGQLTQKHACCDTLYAPPKLRTSCMHVQGQAHEHCMLLGAFFKAGAEDDACMHGQVDLLPCTKCCFRCCCCCFVLLCGSRRVRWTSIFTQLIRSWVCLEMSL